MGYLRNIPDEQMRELLSCKDVGKGRAVLRRILMDSRNKAKAEAVRVSRRKEFKDEFTPLDPKKHGMAGLIRGKMKPRKQDRRASPGEGYAVIFFPRYTRLGKAAVHFFGVERSLSNSPEAAISKFMDGIAKSETWQGMSKAGHRVRKVRITDLGDA